MEIKLPELGEGIESGDVLEVLVQEGDRIEKDQGLLEMETDKATVTVPSPVSGKVTKILVQPGQSVAVGEVIAQVDDADEGGAATESPREQPAAKSDEPSSTQTTAPETPAAGAEQTEEAEPPAPQPTPAQPAGQQEPTPAEETSPQPAAAAQTPTEPQPRATTSSAGPQADVTGTTDENIPAGPAVRRFAREVGIDLHTVQGTGPGGRITREDVLRTVRELGKNRTGAPSAELRGSKANDTQLVTTQAHAVAGRDVALPGEPGSDQYGPVRIERMSKIRKTIAAQMHKSWSTVPRVTNFDDADITDLEALRQASKADYAEQGIKLTTLPFVIKAVAIALRHHPLLNAVIDMENEQIIYRDYVNIGIAVDTPRGLVVPNIRHADQLSISEIARNLADLAVRVRNGNFTVEELRGGTFSISNLGAVGGTYSTPIVNVPEVAILLLGRARKLPVVMPDDSIQPRLMMPLSLSYDHRLVDGAAAARFLNDVISYLESPSRLLLAIS